MGAYATSTFISDQRIVLCDDEKSKSRDLAPRSPGSESALSRNLSCHTCGLIHHIPDLQTGQRAECTRCGSAFSPPGCRRTTASRTAAAAVAAFVLFWPAVLCPILEIEKFGILQQSSILGGTIELLKHGDWLVGGVVLLFSVVFPLKKIVLLLELSLLEFLHKRHKATTLHIMEHVGKWSMMDVEASMWVSFLRWFSVTTCLRFRRQ